MSKRITVKLNMGVVSQKIKHICRSNVVFCEKMGRPNQNYWVSDWKRGKNLPSPEEAARMCAILQVMPEEILTEPKDIDLVKGLIESQRSEQTEKPAPLDGDGLSDKDKRLIAWFRSLPLEKQKALLISQDGPEELAD